MFKEIIREFGKGNFYKNRLYASFTLLLCIVGTFLWLSYGSYIFQSKNQLVNSILWWVILVLGIVYTLYSLFYVITNCEFKSIIVFIATLAISAVFIFQGVFYGEVYFINTIGIIFAFFILSCIYNFFIDLKKSITVNTKLLIHQQKTINWIYHEYWLDKHKTSKFFSWINNYENSLVGLFVSIGKHSFCLLKIAEKLHLKERIEFFFESDNKVTISHGYTTICIIEPEHTIEYDRQDNSSSLTYSSVISLKEYKTTNEYGTTKFIYDRYLVSEIESLCKEYQYEKLTIKLKN